MKITISGTAGSGKSTVAKTVAKKLGYKHFSMGDFQREIAKELGVGIKELGEIEARDKKFDLMVDEKQKKIGFENENFVMDSWLAPKFVPNSFKVFLDADINTRVSRRLSQKRTEESFLESEKAKYDILAREKINRDRWMEYYDYDYTKKDNYDLVIDTTSLYVEEIVDMIIKAVNKPK